MEELRTENFEEYMNFFKSQTLNEKQTIILDQLKLLTTLTNKMCTELNVDNKMLINKELLDVNKENYTEDDFAEAIIVYINSIQNSLCDFDNKLSDIFESFIKNNQ